MKKALSLLSIFLFLSTILAAESIDGTQLQLKIASQLKIIQQEGLIVYLNYSKQLNACGINEIMQPKLLKTRSQIFEAKQKVIRIFSAIAEYRRNCIELFERIEKNFNSLAKTEHERVAFMSSYLANRSKGLKKIFNFIINQEEIGASMLDILEFLEKNIADYSVNEEGKFLFKTDQQLSYYNLLIKNFLLLAEQEKSFQEANTESFEKANELIQQLENPKRRK